MLVALALMMSTPFSPVASALPLDRVRLLESPYRRMQEIDRQYLLRLDPDRLLSRFRSTAGLTPRAEPYGGWESDTLSGHTLGHYLSACAQMAAATGDPELLRRVGAIVDELAECQAAHRNGYVGGHPEPQRLYAEVKARKLEARPFNLNGIWSPLYSLHKTTAGLVDAYRHTGNSKALTVLAGFTRWMEDITRDFTDADWQTFLGVEYGGMPESFAELSRLTGDTRALALAERFHHRAVLDALMERMDELDGKHGNTQIPKAITAAELYELTAQPKYETIARFFWERVTSAHTYVIGGNTSGEYFGPANHLAHRLSGSTAETCNTYNMIKLSGRLMQWAPDGVVGDFVERALLNHILASQKEVGAFTYYVPLNPGSRRTYSGLFEGFTCCMGTGMENHARYGESIAYVGGDTLWLSQYIPSKLDWRELGLALTILTRYPEEGRIHVRVDTKAPATASIRLRIPAWASGARVSVDGRPVPLRVDQGFASVRRVWRGGEVITLTLPMRQRLEATPDRPNRVALLRGPVVYAVDRTGLDRDEAARFPIVVANMDRPQDWLRPGPRGSVLTHGVGRPAELSFRPFSAQVDNPTSVYFDILSDAEWQDEQAQRQAEVDAAAKLAARTVDLFQPGEEADEKAHNLQGETTYSGDFGDRTYRDARDKGWFSFDLKLAGEGPFDLILTYWGSDVRRKFDVLVDGRLVATQTLENNAPGKFFEVTHPLNPAWLGGRSSVTVRLQAPERGMAGGLFGARLVRRIL